MILAGTAVLTLGSCFFFGEVVEGDGHVVVREYVIGNFDDVELASVGKVIVSEGPEERIMVIAEENILEHMDIERDGNCLLISQDANVALQPTQEPLFLVTVPDCDRLHLSGAGSMTTDGKIHTTTLYLIIEGSGEIQAEVDANEVVTLITGKGSIDVKGRATRGDHSIQGSGEIHAFNLSTVNSEAVITGAGDIELNTSDSLRAVIDGVGSIVYRGDPTVSADVEGWGSVHPDY